MRRVVVGFVVFILVSLACARTVAQPPTDSASESTLTLPESPPPRLLREGERAPFTGQLILQADLMQWAMRIESLEHRLTLDVATEIARCDVRLTLEQARTSGAEERLTLHEGLYRERVEELNAALTEARRDAERQWFESPALWFAIGAVVAAGAAIGLAASL